MILPHLFHREWLAACIAGGSHLRQTYTMQNQDLRINENKPAYVLLFALLTLFFMNGCASIRPPAGVKPIEKKLLTTAYCKCSYCCGWERSWFGGAPVYAYGPLKGKRKQVGITASGARAKKGTIAADLSIYPFNTIMYIPDYGYGRVEDCGSGVKGNHIELFYSSHKQALKWGKVTKKVKIWLP